MMRQSPESSVTGSEEGIPPDSLPVRTIILRGLVPVQPVAGSPTD
jgi:hypothetical protein